MVEGIVTMAVWIIMLAIFGALGLLVYTVASMVINRYYRHKRQMDKLQAENAFLRRKLASEREINRQIREDYYAEK